MGKGGRDGIVATLQKRWHPLLSMQRYKEAGKHCKSFVAYAWLIMQWAARQRDKAQQDVHAMGPRREVLSLPSKI